MSVVEQARDVVLGAIEQRTFPGASVDVGESHGALWREVFGTTAFAPASPRTSLPTPLATPPATTEATLYDLASLTKVVATTTVIMDLVGSGLARLDDRIADSFPEWRGTDREGVTVQDLLEHASGLPARLLEAPPATRREFEHDICTMRLAYPPRTKSIYSDLGFILLGMLAEARGGATLDRQFDAIRVRLGVAESLLAGKHLTFKLSGSTKGRAAPTMPQDDDARRGRILTGEVHDNYAAALGGVAGHAGLFGTAAAMGAFARLVLRAARGGAVPPPLSSTGVARFTRKSAVPGSSRALGWDTMLPTSSCGTRMSAGAIGHVGFTGTSLWIDPPRDRYFVLLSNRVANGGTLDEMRSIRRSFHDALATL
ncbi:MAG: serine hydrolase domain-containing protein [Acidobacteriota bacterium]